MLYAPITDKFHWPMEWDRVESMFKYLNRMTWGYQLNMEKKMFAMQYGAEYRASLIKWEAGNRNVLLETDDPKQMEAALLMLISEAEPEYREAKQKWVQI